MRYVWLAACVLCMFAVSPTAAADPIKALIIDGQNNHAWADTTPVLKKIMEDSGRFTVDVATTPPAGQDMSSFRPDFDQYDVLVMNYTGDAWPEETNAAFERYVREGGGLVIYHAANNAFPRWKEYNEMIAVGGWGGRNERSGPYLYWEDGKAVRDTSPGPGGSHGPQTPFQVVIRDADHPITRGLPPVHMHPTDELYDRLRGPAVNVTILATAYSEPSNRGTGRHEPMLMVIDYGKGRVFHTALGHHVRQIQSVGFITTLLRGCEWAATGEVTIPVPDDFPGPDEPTFRE